MQKIEQDSDSVIEPRKLPQQQRARNTVQRILDATDTIIAEGGLQAVTTNKIAVQAHINISSLYQYFPNKDAVINALIQRHEQHFARGLNELLKSMDNVPLREAATGVVQSALVQLRHSQAVMPTLVARLGATHEYPEARKMENRFLEAMRRYFILQRDNFDLRDLDTSVYIIYTAVSATVIKHVMDPLPYLSDEELTQEIVQLMCAYFPIKA